MDDLLIDAWMVDLAGRTARAVAMRATAGRLAWVNERDHMDPACRCAGSELAVVSEPVPRFSKGVKPAYADFPRLGGVDVIVDWSDFRAAVELKCGSGKKAVLPCAWDAVKL